LEGETVSMTGGAEEAKEPAAHTEAPPWMDPTVGRSQVVIALFVTLLISRFPEIVARELLSLEVPWMGWAVVGLTIGLWAAARAIPVLRKLERFLAVMVAVNVLIAILPALRRRPERRNADAAKGRDIPSVASVRVDRGAVPGRADGVVRVPAPPFHL